MADPFSEDVVRSALANWGLESASYDLISHSENVVYKITTTQSQFVLRIHRPGYNSTIELESEVAWTEALNKNAIPTPQQVRSLTKNFFVVVTVASGDVRTAGLIEWLEGHLLADPIEEADANEAIQYYESLGTMLARLHNQANEWTPPVSFRRRTWDADGLMGNAPLWGQFWQAPALSTDERAFLKGVRKLLHTDLSDLPRERETFSLIHADLHPHNVLVQGESLYVIDFDDCGFGWHYYDLAVALHQVRGHTHFRDIEYALLKGYRSLRALPDAESQLPLFYLTRTLVGLGWISARPELSTVDKVRQRIPAIIEEAQNYVNGR